MHFGNLYADARRAKSLHDRSNFGGWDARPKEIENGWRFIGSGHSRWAYLSPRKVVYKVGTESCNKGEHEAAQILSKIDHPLLGIPKTHYYPTLGVLAMEYIEGKPGMPRAYAKYRRLVDQFMVDQVRLNFIYDGTKVWVIDFGEFADAAAQRTLERKVQNFKP